jgi:hypothetical protein
VAEQSLAEFLTEIQADRDTIQQAARYYLAEITEDLDPGDMRQELVQQAQDPEQVDPLLHTLEKDTASVEEASLLLLSAAWADPSQRERVKSALEEAKRKLPVIETAIIAIVVMYGMYLVATGGVMKSEERTTRKADGSIETVKTTEYAGPTGPLQAVASLFGW